MKCYKHMLKVKIMKTEAKRNCQIKNKTIPSKKLKALELEIIRNQSLEIDAAEEF